MTSLNKDLEGKVAVITGANSGIGLEAAVKLAARGSTVVLCCRSMDRALQAQTSVLERSKASKDAVHVVQLDLADLDNIASFRSRYDAVPALAAKPVDMLILNAGVMALPKLELTKDNVEMQMGTNVVGHYKFAYEMMDKCLQAERCRIVVISSGFHRYVSTISFDDFTSKSAAKYSRWTAYGESKLGNVLFMAKLNRLLEQSKLGHVVAVGAHPGYSATELQRHTGLGRLNYLFSQSAERGSEPTVLAATDSSMTARNGYAGPSGMFEMWGAAKWKCALSSAVFNQDLQDKLWQKCAEITKCDIASKL